MTYPHSPRKPFSFTLVNLLGHFFSFETVFVLFIFTGLFKGDPRLAWIPLDITLLLFVASGIAAMLVLLRGGFVFNPQALVFVMSGLGFFVWFVGSLLWSDSVEYGPEKAQELGLLVLWCFLGSAFIVAQNKTRFYRFAVMVFVLSSAYTISGFLTPANASGFIEVYGSNYLALSFIIGCGTVIIFFYFLKSLSKGTFFLLLTLGALMVFFSYVQLSTGGRGPLVSTVIALLAMLFAVMVRKDMAIPLNRGLSLFTVVVLLLLGLTFSPVTQGEQSQTIRRLDSAISGQNLNSVDERLFRFNVSIELFSQRPLFGYGIGAWPLHALSTDERSYPHNIFLEIAVESGVVGLALFVFLLIVAVYYCLRTPSSEGLLWLGLFVLVFVSAQVSGDLSDNRRLFAFLGLATIFTHIGQIGQVGQISQYTQIGPFGRSGTKPEGGR